MHVATCSSFEIDLETDSPHPSNCLINHPTADDSNDDDMLNKFAEYEDIPAGTSLKLDPRGYR